MRACVLVCVAACLVMLASEARGGALVCTHRYCRDHPCTAPVPASSCRSPAVYRAEHAAKGAACKSYSKELGATPNAVCKDGLRCVSGRCEQLGRA